jgi:endonuclease V-like protein UPF0215 family
MKKEARIIGIDDSAFNKFKDKEVLVIGTFFRGGSFIDGVTSTSVKVDGSDSTSKLTKMIKKSKFFPQIQAILLDGIAFAGFNVIDIEKLNSKTKIPVITIIRRMPDIANIKRILKKIKKASKIKLIEKAGKPIKIKNIYCQFIGIKKQEVEKLLKITCTHSDIPEPIRVAHLIATGIVKGESKGRA